MSEAPPAHCIAEYIADDIIDTLEDITTTGGYEVELTSVEWFDPNGNEPAHLKAVVELDDDSMNEAIPQTTQDDAHVLRFLVRVWYMTDPAESIPIDFMLIRVWAAIVKAMAVDHTRDNYAWDTKVEGGQFFEDFVIVPIVVNYTHALNDPYTK